MDNTLCGELRESVELLVILNTLHRRRDEYMVEARLTSLMDRREKFINTIINVCGKEIAEKYEEVINNPEDDELLTNVLLLLHKCMVRNGCESNILLEEQQ